MPRCYLTAVDLTLRKDTCVVVGSGLLLEVPLDALAQRFGRVYLIDMFHMPSVRRAAKYHGNVSLLTGDITGVFTAIKEGPAPGPHVPAPPAKIPHLAEADLVVSCNCLTQLAGPFIAIFGQSPSFSDLDADKLAYQIMGNHAHAIATGARGVGLIITDIERHALAGVHTTERIDLLKALKLPPTPTHTHNEEGSWRIAPRGEDPPRHDIEHIVAARVYERAPSNAALAASDDDRPVASSRRRKIGI